MLALAFVKINNRPFVEVVQNAFLFYTNSNLYTWRKTKQQEINVNQVVQKQDRPDLVPKSGAVKLKDLALGLDIKVDNDNI